MAQAQTNGSNGNGDAVKAPKTSILDAPKAVFENRKSPAKPAELKAALEAYFKLDDEMKALNEKLEALKAKRTKATIEIVELRGTGRLDTKTRGTGQITANGPGAWILFMTATGDTIDV